MTTEQIMVRLREIEAELDATDGFRWYIRDYEFTQHLDAAKKSLCNLIEQMLADERQAREAHTMAELPFDGQKVKP